MKNPAQVDSRLWNSLSDLFSTQQFPDVTVVGEEDQDDLIGVEAADQDTTFEMDNTVLQQQIPDSLSKVTANQVDSKPEKSSSLDHRCVWR